ncbi:hypothetical protein [Paraburkholderia silvatlantica]|uniref:hypothetical protein n=1 Tax=Paraburkholderia silvatlantica TaxID=321895 RepID=UPI0037527957
MSSSIAKMGCDMLRRKRKILLQESTLRKPQAWQCCGLEEGLLLAALSIAAAARRRMRQAVAAMPAFPGLRPVV